jgi:transposase InsO family protein
MDIHDNARTTRHSRMLMVQRLTSGWTVAVVAAAQGVSPKTVRKWRDRYAAEGEVGLADRSSRPHHSPRQLAAPIATEIVTLRHERLSSPAIARRLGRPVSTIGAVLRRHRLGRLSALTPRPPVIRYERDIPGELIHIDIKKLGRIEGIGHRITGDRTGQSNRRGIGWEFVHVAVDDASRLAYTELLPDERKESAVAFTTRAIDWFAHHGVTVERIMTDNGSAYRSHAFRDLLCQRAVKHKRTRPYTPRTNGKAERFIQTSLREWAYAQPFHSSAERAAAMLPWITDYNATRPHSALGGNPPISRIIGFNVSAATTASDTSDPKPGFAGVAGVKPRVATAAGGWGLTPATPAQAQSVIEWDNLLGNDT